MKEINPGWYAQYVIEGITGLMTVIISSKQESEPNDHRSIVNLDIYTIHNIKYTS